MTKVSLDLDNNTTYKINVEGETFLVDEDYDDVPIETIDYMEWKEIFKHFFILNQDVDIAKRMADKYLQALQEKREEIFND